MIIRRLFVLSTSLFVLAGCSDPTDTPEAAPAPADVRDPRMLDSATRHELLVAREAVWRAFFEGDTTRLIELLPDSMFAMEGGREKILADSRGFAASGGRFVGISFTDDQFFVRGDVAQLQSRYKVLLSTAGKTDSLMGFAIELFEKRNERWVNPSWHLDEVRHP